LGEYPQVEWGVVGRDELDLDQVLAAGEARQSFVEAVVHGDQLAVDQPVIWPWSGRMRVVVWEMILAPARAEADLGGLPADGLAVAGGKDGELGG